MHLVGWLKFTVANPSVVSVTFRHSRYSKWDRLAYSTSNKTGSETIETLERSGSQTRDTCRLASASLFATGAIMVFAVIGVHLSQVPEFLDAKINFSIGDAIRVIAGR